MCSGLDESPRDLSFPRGLWWPAPVAIRGRVIVCILWFFVGVFAFPFPLLCWFLDIIFRWLVFPFAYTQPRYSAS